LYCLTSDHTLFHQFLLVSYVSISFFFSHLQAKKLDATEDVSLWGKKIFGTQVPLSISFAEEALYSFLF
jgi:hypothetical protein